MRSLVNTNGYRRDSPNKDNPINVIPSGNITMENVDFPIKATPVYNSGQGPTEVLEPGQKRNFKGAEYVIEEKAQKQTNMANRFDKYFPNQFQFGGMANFNPEDYRPNTNVSVYNQPMQTVSQQAQAQQQMPPPMDTSGAVNSDTASTGVLPPPKKDFQTDVDVQQFDNPYGGIDTEGAAVALGQGLESGNPLSIIGGAGKIGLSMFRNITSGVAQERARRRDQKAYNEKLRDSIGVNPSNSTVMQSGGTNKRNTKRR